MNSWRWLIASLLALVPACKTTNQAKHVNDRRLSTDADPQGKDSVGGPSSNAPADGPVFGATGPLTRFQPKTGVVSILGWCRSGLRNVNINLMTDGTYTGNMGSGDFKFAGDILSFIRKDQVVAKCFVKDTTFEEVYAPVFFENENLSPVNPGSSLQCDAFQGSSNLWNCELSYFNRPCEFTFSCERDPRTPPAPEVRTGG